MRSDNRMRHAAALLTVPLLLVTMPISGARLHEATAQAPSHTTLDTTITDTHITRALEREYLADPAVPSTDVTVQTADGIVTLRGDVPSLLASQAAVDIAKATRGVRSVVNELTVSAPMRTDAEILADVREALRQDPATEAMAITTTVTDGVATLTGTASSWAEKRLARHVAAGVTGVRGVRNDLAVDVNAWGSRSDAEIEADVRGLLDAHAMLSDADIDVDVNAAQVRLEGTVGSAAERDLAYWTSLVVGVMDVNTDGLEVRWWAQDPMTRDTAPAPSDARIRSAILDAYHQSPRVTTFKPAVAVADGMVTLTGTVGNLAARAEAERLARNTVGVEGVTNRIEVHVPDPVSDMALAGAVSRALMRDPYLATTDLTVVADDGVVTLGGTVHSRFLRERAEDVTERQRAVLAVVNMIELDDEWISKSDVALENDVKAELFWNPWVTASEVAVTADNGIVTLSGTVDTWMERDEAELEAYAAGARQVVNNLLVDL